MKELDLSSYRKVNESFSRKMVCRIGIDCGFFTEMNYMVNAMLYCLDHRVKFLLYSEDANFATGVGWTEYFQPFCEEVHERFHRKYNFHKMPSWKQIINGCRKQKSMNLILWKLKLMLRTIIGRLITFWTYRECVLLSQDVSVDTDRHYIVSELEINGSYHEVFALLTRMIWKFQPEILYQKQKYIDLLSLPTLYNGIHIRDGDKISEAKLIGGTQIMQLLPPKNNLCVFVLTDDYRQFQELQIKYPTIQFLTLCQPEERGYNHKTFCQMPPESRKEAIIRLMISVDFLLSSHAFVGSITTGPNIFVMKLRVNDSLVRAVDCNKENLEASLSLSIDARSKISKHNMQRKS